MHDSQILKVWDTTKLYLLCSRKIYPLDFDTHSSGIDEMGLSFPVHNMLHEYANHLQGAWIQNRKNNATVNTLLNTYLV